MRSWVQSISVQLANRFRGALEKVTAIDDFKFDTSPQNETTTVMVYHFLNRLAGADIEDEVYGHRTLL